MDEVDEQLDDFSFRLPKRVKKLQFKVKESGDDDQDNVVKRRGRILKPTVSNDENSKKVQHEELDEEVKPKQFDDDYWLNLRK